MKTLSVLTVSLLPAVAFAAPQNFKEFIDIIVDIIRLLIPVLAALALTGFFWGLAKFILAAGNEDAISEGKQLMLWGTIALFVMVSVWGIVGLVTGSFFGTGVGLPTLPTGSGG